MGNPTDHDYLANLIADLDPQGKRKPDTVDLEVLEIANLLEEMKVKLPKHPDWSGEAYATSASFRSGV